MHQPNHSSNPISLQTDLTTVMQATAEVVDKLITSNDLDELLERIVRLSQQTLNYDQVSLYLLGPEQEVFVAKIISNKHNQQVIRGYPQPNEVTPAYQVIEQLHPLYLSAINNKSNDDDLTLPDHIFSELYIPLSRGEKKVGVLSFGSTRQNAFDNPEITLILVSFATQITIAIDRIRRQEYLSNHYSSSEANRQKKLYQIGPDYQLQTLDLDIQSLDRIQEVYDKIVTGVVDRLKYQGAMLAVLDEETQTLPVQAYAFNSVIRRLRLVEMAEKHTDIKIIGTYASLVKDTDNLGVKSCLSGEPQISHDLYELFQPALSPEFSRRLQRLSGVKTCVSIPLIVDKKVVGNLYTATKKVEISDKDLNDLRIFVTNAAIAVQNATLFEQVNLELDSRKAQLMQLRGIQNLIISSLDLQEVLSRILRGALELTRAEYGQAVLSGKYATDLVHRVTFPEPSSERTDERMGITQVIMRDRKPKLIQNKDLIASEKNELKELIEGPFAKMKAHLGVPITLGDDLVGAITIASQEAGAFDEESLQLLEQLAIQAAIAIDNAYQFKSQQEMQNRLSNANQVVAMGDIASNMVHSINNWVGSIRVQANYLLSKIEKNTLDPKQGQEILNAIVRDAERTIARAEKISQPLVAQSQELINVNECLLSALQQQDKSPTIKIRQSLNDLPLVTATQQLEQVFDNLIKNAIQVMSDNKNWQVLSFTTNLSSDKRFVEATIADTGPGLPKSINPDEIFKLGITSRKEGMGYGLWWCDTYLKRIGGSIKLVDNSPGGCKFLIRLPVNRSED